MRPLIILTASATILGIILGSSSPSLAGEENPIHWSYGGATNPTQWSHLSEQFAMCEKGQDQSPINIQRVVEGAPKQIKFNYGSVPLKVRNNGHTIQVDYEQGSTITIDNEVYRLVQLHFHTPGEHNITGIAWPMELHLVHQNSQGEFAVIGVMIESGKEHSTITQIWQNIPSKGQVNSSQEMTINAIDLLPNDTSYWSYNGSLTTPPCSQGVQWYVLTHPIEISEEQISVFEDLYPVNARPVQPVNGRVVELHKN